MEAKHTIGPWNVDSLGIITGGHGGLTSIGETCGHSWALCQANAATKGNIEAAEFCGMMYAEARANARLIAAAPDLLEALEMAAIIVYASSGRCTQATEIERKVRKAISKAKGE